MAPTINMYSAAFTDYIVKLVSYQKKDLQEGPNNGYDNEKDLEAHFPKTQLIIISLQCLLLKI